MPVVIGVPRSGTTLLRLMLDSHPQLAIPPETGFLTHLAELNPDADCSRAASDLITGFETWPDFHMDRAALDAALAAEAPCTPAVAARTFYRLYSQRFNKPRWGDKTPSYAGEIDRIARLLPESRFVHVIRDGRDVAVSVRPLWFAPSTVIDDIAGDWVGRIQRARELARRVPHYLELRYEALVAEPAATLRRICAFLDLPYDDAMLGYHERAGSRLDEHEARIARDGRVIISKTARRANQRLTMEPPRIDRIGRWRNVLSGDEVERFESVAGDWLEQLGYERERALL